MEQVASVEHSVFGNRQPQSQHYYGLELRDDLSWRRGEKGASIPVPASCPFRGSALSGQGPPSQSGTPMVCIVDDDPSIRDALSGLLRSVSHRVAVFGSCDAFFDEGQARSVGCLIVDIRLPGMSGLEFQAQLMRGGRPIPMVFMTGHGDVEMSVRAMKGGAVDFLEKPFREQDMLDAVGAAMVLDRRWRDREQAGLAVRQAFEALTAREREVMALVTTGLMNKQIAGEVHLSEVTVKIHRANVMRKMGARSLAELVRMADLLALTSASARKIGSIMV